MNPEIIYDKLRNGDPITDKELDYGIEYFSMLQELLSPLGRTFHLAWREAYRVFNDLNSFKEARKRK